MRLRVATPRGPSLLEDGEAPCLLAAALGMIGETIGHYRIEEKLGEGGVGEVFRATDLGLDRSVAIKRLRPELTVRKQLVTRFRAEARTLARLNHTNIATLYSLVEDEHGLLMVMEFVDGETLAKILRASAGLPLERALPLFFQALDGLGYAHERGIIHRDIKGSNLMVKSCGTLKVMDFGIARMLGSERMTQLGQLVGTPEFMSPEQIRGEEADARSDIYSLGILLYALLSGRMPFSAKSSFDLMKAHVDAPPPPLAKLAPNLPAGLEEALSRSLEKEPALRYESTAAFRAALEPFLPSGAGLEAMTPLPVAPTPPDPREPAPRLAASTRIMTQLETGTPDERPTRERSHGAGGAIRLEAPQPAAAGTMDAATVSESDLEPLGAPDPARSPAVDAAGVEHSGPGADQAETRTPATPDGSAALDPTGASARQRRHLLAWFLAPSVIAIFLMGANVLWVASVGAPEQIETPGSSVEVSPAREASDSEAPAGLAADPHAPVAPRQSEPRPAVQPTRTQEPEAAAAAPSPANQGAGKPEAAAPEARVSRELETAARSEERPRTEKRRRAKTKRRRRQQEERDPPTQKKESRGWIVRRR